jgi:hypothetical protein
MTDHPRFAPLKGGIDEAYQRYHGAAVVAAALRAVDWWLRARSVGAVSSSTPNSYSRQPERRAVHRAVQLVCVIGVWFLAAPDLVAQDQCAGVPVHVTAASPDERHLACSAASDAIHLLGRCGIALRRPLDVQIMSEVRHPFGGAIFGLFDIKQQSVLVTQEANIPSLVEGTPYAALPQRDFYRSLIVHEVIHGVMHQNLKRPAASHVAYEYPAYALQIESLTANVRDEFLRSFDQTAIAANTLFNDSVLLFDPYFFAARAYHHFKTSAHGCTHLTALLEGEVDFIAPM